MFSYNSTLNSQEKKIVNSFSSLNSVILKGDCGMGRSSFIKNLAEKISFNDIKFNHFTFRLSCLFDTSDIENSVFNDISKSPTILILEDIESCSINMLDFASNLLNKRQFKNKSLPDNVFVVAIVSKSFNFEKFEMISSENLDFFDFSIDLQYWIEEYANGKIDQHIINFLKDNPDSFINFKNSYELMCTPRSWEIFSKVIEMQIENSKDISELISDIPFQSLSETIIGKENFLEFSKYIKSNN